ncbi:MAG TPA: methylthioribulose 1-phosphate dehydratase [Blastocatellia bacterium]|nr:methylthioribulose 1-phosphate dehydratase [Blastocatellia bacterium]
MKEPRTDFLALATELATVGRSFYGRGWALGTSGNFSAVSSCAPLRLAITSSGVDKGELTAEHILEIDAAAQVVAGTGRPSAETLLHLSVVRLRGAGAVLHTHSVWSNILSGASRDGIAIEGHEMLKGLDGVTTHEHREWLPVIDNSQDMARLAQAVEASLQAHPRAHGFLLRRHGLYTWGRDLAEAKRHVEIFEYLLEVTGRSHRPHGE